MYSNNSQCQETSASSGLTLFIDRSTRESKSNASKHW